MYPYVHVHMHCCLPPFPYCRSKTTNVISLFSDSCKHANTHLHHVCACAHAHARTHTHTHTHTNKHTRTHKQKHTYKHTQTHTNTHTHTHTHTQVWRYDGTVECYTEGHLPLAIWAGTVLAIYTLFSLLVPISTHVLLAAVSPQVKGQQCVHIYIHTVGNVGSFYTMKFV